ncbi:hypothetical protein [Prolixibacter sp. NT017]|uniref:hypothetical protein n=1 Tax=Prolixibacter sp. NT017 TaxID=2652390 RepID=UPI0012876ECE|nr:hypothetical protein [Prolixibacter sp. NT017]GET26480.1 hypothetical protein NT017_28090 [Prolixibacter sp. NT017]
MRTIVFILFILSVFTTSAFSQEKLLLNLETTGIDVSTYTDFGKYYQESRQQPVTVLTLPELNQSSKENIRGSRSNLNPLDILENNCSYDVLALCETCANRCDACGEAGYDYSLYA